MYVTDLIYIQKKKENELKRKRNIIIKRIIAATIEFGLTKKKQPIDIVLDTIINSLNRINIPQ